MTAQITDKGLRIRSTNPGRGLVRPVVACAKRVRGWYHLR